MPDVATIADEAAALLAERVGRLARLIEAHPAYDLLAEYEALFLDRHPCAAESVACLERAATDLLDRIETSIRSLETVTGSPAGAEGSAPEGSFKTISGPVFDAA